MLRSVGIRWFLRLQIRVLGAPFGAVFWGILASIGANSPALLGTASWSCILVLLVLCCCVFCVLHVDNFFISLNVHFCVFCPFCSCLLGVLKIEGDLFLSWRVWQSTHLCRGRQNVCSNSGPVIWRGKGGQSVLLLHSQIDVDFLVIDIVGENSKPIFLWNKTRPHPWGAL